MRFIIRIILLLFNIALYAQNNLQGNFPPPDTIQKIRISKTNANLKITVSQNNACVRDYR